MRNLDRVFKLGAFAREQQKPWQGQTGDVAEL
jgi:hypothetical protein